MLLNLETVEPASCDGCGLCCEGIGSPVALYASRPEYGADHPYRPPGLPGELLIEIDEHFLGLVRGQEPQDCCLWYDRAARRCLHYDWRPQVCRDYELGCRACCDLRRAHVRHTIAPACAPALAATPIRSTGVTAVPRPPD